jgi:agmatine deiminase
MSGRTPASLGYRMPAEWHPHASTWLTWPKDPVTWPDRVPQAQDIFVTFIEALTPHERVDLLVDDADVEADVRARCRARGVHLDRLVCHHVPTVDSWIRDYGPNFLVNDAGDLAFNHWIFNAWGNKYDSLLRDADVPRRLDVLADAPRFEPGIVLEGGSIDVDGNETVLTTEQCLLNPNRNPSLSREEIETHLRDYLGVRQVLWLGEGIEGDDTDGHVDDITRFVSPDTIVTVVENDPADPNHAPLADNLRRLELALNAFGHPYRVVTLPMPGVVPDGEGGRLPASYANFYIANGVVLVPVYGHANDQRALDILAPLFPTRRLVPIPCEPLVWGMGSIHCVTQQQPASQGSRLGA